jgi:hypothetical protein
VFTPAERDQVRDHIVGMGQADERILAGALLGSLADGRADAWSDLDLTFAVREGESIALVLDDWTRRLGVDVEGVMLFDLAVGSTTYRVFMLPGSLQVDLSFTPVADFRPRGPSFRLLFGSADAARFTPPPSLTELAGLAILDVRVTRVAIERGRYWQAAYFLESLRNHVLALAAVKRGLKGAYARSTDDLPAELLDRAAKTLTASLDSHALSVGLLAGVELLIGEAADVAPAVRVLEADLRELASSGA